MKVEIEIDLTPQEARALLGLPDLQPLHDVYLERMTSFVEKGVTPELLGEMVKSWSSLGGAGVGMIQQLIGGMAGGLSGTRRTDAEGDEDKQGSRKR